MQELDDVVRRSDDREYAFGNASGYFTRLWMIEYAIRCVDAELAGSQGGTGG